jgi:hypothetical protein
MFDFLRKSSENKLYEFVVPVTQGAASPLVLNGDGRIVCYATGRNEDTAKQHAIRNLQAHQCTVHAGWKSAEVDAKKWAGYVRTRWPYVAASLPTQEEVTAIMLQGGVFYGPAEP